MSSDQLAAATAAPSSDDGLDSRPSLSRPDALSPAALADARRNQPLRALTGLAFVVPVTVLMSVGAGGAHQSLIVLGPIITFALPLMAMIAFWWEDWPGTLLPRPWSGLYDTAIVVVGGVLLTMLGQLLVNGPDLIGVFVPGPAHPGTYPETVELAGGIFTIMLQLTLVSERWPLNGLGRIRSGLAALAVCWVLGLAAWLIAIRWLAVTPQNYGAWLTSIGACQMLFYTALRGWPFARIGRKWLRLLLSNVVVIACGWVGYLFVHSLDWPGTQITAVAGTAIGCILLVSMLFEAWPAIHIDRVAVGRALAVLVAAILTALLTWWLPSVADALGVPEERRWSWTTQVTLNALSTAVILHVAVWRRWPVRSPDS